MSEFSLRPRSLGASESAEGKTLAHFLLKLRNHIGALEDVSSVAGRNSVNILSGFHEAPVGSDASWSFFADMTDAKLSADRLADEFSKLPSVLEVKFRVTSSGFIADAFHFPVRLGTRPLVMFSVDSMISIFRHMKEMLGDKVAVVLIHQMGISAGEGIYRGFEIRFGKGASREALEEFLHSVRASGWGCETLKALNVENSNAVIEFTHSAECSSYSHEATPQSQFIRGTYSGFFSGFFGKHIDADEVRCVAKGDPACEFALNPR